MDGVPGGHDDRGEGGAPAWLAGAKRKRIAAEIGLDPKTVRRYIGAAVECGLAPEGGDGKLCDEELIAVLARLRGEAIGRPRGERWARCEAERAFIERHLAQGVRLSKVREAAAAARRRGAAIRRCYRFAVAELGFGEGRADRSRRRRRAGRGGAGRHGMDDPARARPRERRPASALPGLDLHAGGFALPLRLPVPSGDDGDGDRGVRGGLGVLRRRLPDPRRR